MTMFMNQVAFLALGNGSDRGLIELMLVVLVIACFVGGYRLGPGLGYYGGGGVGMLLLIVLACLLLGVI